MDVRDRRHRHWQAGMPGARLLHGIHAQRPNRVDAQPIKCFRGRVREGGGRLGAHAGTATR